MILDVSDLFQSFIGIPTYTVLIDNFSNSFLLILYRNLYRTIKLLVLSMHWLALFFVIL